jgi:hypothetical protein
MPSLRNGHHVRQHCCWQHVRVIHRPLEGSADVI